MLTRVPSSLIVWPIQRTVKSWLLAEVAEAGHMRNIYVRNYQLRNRTCAIIGAQLLGWWRAPSKPSCTTRRCCGRSRTRCATGSSPSSTPRGSLRAADLARELDIPANQASFHLRQLAKYGLVEEDPAAARDKRDRVWRVVDEGGFTIEIGEIEKAAGRQGRLARSSAQNQAAWGHLVVDAALRRRARAGHPRTVTDRRSG